MPVYLARFDTGTTEFATALLEWPVPDGLLVPRSWSRLLLTERRLDWALRIASGPAAGIAFLMLTGPLGEQETIRALAEALLANEPPPGLSHARDPDEYDARVIRVPGVQLGVNHEGYHYRGVPLACDFRLYAPFASRPGGSDATYQVHFRRHSPGVETRREVRKYVAWLDLEKPFTEPVRAMQRLLAERLLSSGWLASEYLAVDDSAERQAWVKRIETQFAETTGQMGFSAPPLDEGDFSDVLFTGYHPLSDLGYAPHVAVRGAGLMSDEECRLLLGGNYSVHTGGSPAAAPDDRVDVFISYASSDYAYAADLCQFLESDGRRCWIAPRDIQRVLVPWPEAILQGIARARALIVLVSDTANVSVHVPREIERALDRRLAIVPVRLQNVMPAGQLEYLLATCQWLDAYDRDWGSALGELRGRLDAL